MPAARVNVFILGPDETCALSVVPKKLETVGINVRRIIDFHFCHSNESPESSRSDDVKDRCEICFHQQR